MGHDVSLQLREQNLMTKIMLKQEQEVIDYLKETKLDVARPINQVDLALTTSSETPSSTMQPTTPSKN
jgi:hypothetical protein